MTLHIEFSFSYIWFRLLGDSIKIPSVIKRWIIVSYSKLTYYVLLKNYYLFLFYVFVGFIFMYLHNLHLVVMEVRRRYWILPCGCWEFACLYSDVVLLSYLLGFVPDSHFFSPRSRLSVAWHSFLANIFFLTLPDSALHFSRASRVHTALGAIVPAILLCSGLCPFSSPLWSQTDANPCVKSLSNPAL